MHMAMDAMASPEITPPLTYSSPVSQDSPDAKSPLSNFGFLKNLNVDKKPTKGTKRLLFYLRVVVSRYLQMGSHQSVEGPNPIASLP